MLPQPFVTVKDTAFGDQLLKIAIVQYPNPLKRRVGFENAEPIKKGD